MRSIRSVAGEELASCIGDQEIMVLALPTVFPEMEKLLCCGIHEMDEEWATTSSGSTHMSDYTWTEKTDDRSSEEDSVSSEGSAHSAKYTEEDEESRTGPTVRRNIPAFHALG